MGKGGRVDREGGGEGEWRVRERGAGRERNWEGRRVEREGRWRVERERGDGERVDRERAREGGERERK